ncbi:BQ5605_C023g09753 [Microbotryum silenes-dioicae]|uniref:BQ5605_C023g09753 protein n=1 Tax=Microbotryum silenes-dioicae TaxID=796604 RepID=A0A2X0MLK5_9BASI|nr:BQ5605_C023g09753 [Microbotryum silenes-dioicae]
MGLPKALMHSMTERGIAHASSSSSSTNALNRSEAGNKGSSLPLAPSSTGTLNDSVLRLKIAIDPGWWLAGETVRGVLEVGVATDLLALGEVGVEFTGFEELRSQNHTSTRRILTSRIDFQGGTLPPSNAVVPGSKPINGHKGYYPALKGKTKFKFSFKLPKEAPSSCTLGTNATMRYELRAFANSVLGGSVDVRSVKCPVPVVERWADWEAGVWWDAKEGRAAASLRLGGEGKLDLTCSVGKGDWDEKPVRLFWRRDTEVGAIGKGRITIQARVKNGTKKHVSDELHAGVSDLKVSICRRLRIIYPEGQEPMIPAPIVTAVITSQSFHGAEFAFPPGEERECVIVVDLPREEVITVRKGKLFELDAFVKIEADGGLLASDLAVELPLFIAHPHSLPPSAHAFIREQVDSKTAPPASHQSHPVLSPSPVGFLNAQERAGSFVDLNEVGGGPSRSGSVVSFGSSPLPGPGFMSPFVGGLSQQQYMMPQSMSQHYGIPPSPSAADLYVGVNPNQPDLTPSRFCDRLAHQNQQQLPTPASTVSSRHQPLPPRPSSSISFNGHPGDYAVLAPPPPVNVNGQTFPSPYAPPPRPLSAHSLPPIPTGPPYNGFHPMALPSNGNAGPPIPPPLRSPAPNEQSPAHVAAIPSCPTNQCTDAGASTYGLNYATPPSTWDQYAPTSVPEPSNSPAPSTHRPGSAGSSTARSTPPPPSAPSARYSSPQLASTTISNGLVQQLSTSSETGLLETIGEDGESQAGTACSMKPEVVNALKDLSEANDEAVRSVHGHMAIMPTRSSAQNLEDLVDEEDRRTSAAANHKKHEPSDAQIKPKSPPRSTPRAQDIFSAPIGDAKLESRPPSPSKSPSRGLAFPRAEGGLSALEKRLSRPATPEVHSVSVAEASGRVRTMSVGNGMEVDDTVEAVRKARAGIAYPPPRARQDTVGSPVVYQVETTQTVADERRPEPAQPIRQAQPVELAAIPAREPPSQPEPPRVATPEAAVPPQATLAAPNSPETPRRRPTFKSRNRNTYDAQPVGNNLAGPSVTASVTLEPTTSKQLILPVENGRKVVDGAEVQVLKKDAVSRVANWLQSSPKVAPDPQVKALPSARDERPQSPLMRSHPPASTSSPSKPVSISPWSLRASNRAGHQSTRSEPVNVRPASPLKRSESNTVLKALEPTMESVIHKNDRIVRSGSYLCRLSSKHDFPLEARRSPTKSSWLEGDLTRPPSSPTMGSFASANDLSYQAMRAGRGGAVSDAARKWSAVANVVEEPEEEVHMVKPLPRFGAKKALLTTSVSQPLLPVGNRDLPARKPTSPSASLSSSPTRVHSPSLAKAFVNTTMGRGCVFARSNSRSGTDGSPTSLRTSASVPSGLAARRARYEAAAAALT